MTPLHEAIEQFRLLHEVTAKERQMTRKAYKAKKAVVGPFKRRPKRKFAKFAARQAPKETNSASQAEPGACLEVGPGQCKSPWISVFGKCCRPKGWKGKSKG